MEKADEGKQKERKGGNRTNKERMHKKKIEMKHKGKEIKKEKMNSDKDFLYFLSIFKAMIYYLNIFQVL